jgi:hypothetical protein
VNALYLDDDDDDDDDDDKHTPNMFQVEGAWKCF